MHHVYLLRSSLYNKIYIGESSDVGVRIIYHNQGPKKGWKSGYRPWVLVHMEEMADRSAALKWEKQLKSAAGRRCVWDEVIKSKRQNIIDLTVRAWDSYPPDILLFGFIAVIPTPYFRA